MEAIWKFPLSVTDKQVIPMPQGARIITVQTQRERPCLWAICDTTAPKVARTFAIYGTGHEYNKIEGSYIGTTMMQGGDLVWHIFEIA